MPRGANATTTIISCHRSRVEPGRVAGDKFRRFAERLDHQRAEQRPEHRADAADDRREQRLDRNPRAIGDAGIDEQKILRVEAAAAAVSAAETVMAQSFIRVGITPSALAASSFSRIATR